MSIEQILSIPKSFYVSWRLTSLKEAVYFPILVRYNCKLISLKGHIRLNKMCKKTARLVIGFNEVGIYNKKFSSSILQIDGEIRLNGQATFGQGSKLCVMQNAILEIGDQFNNTAEGVIVCTERISIGKNCLMSWETIIMDSDWHQTENTETKEISKEASPIIIQENCWIGMRSLILKGVQIAQGCIIAANSTVTRSCHNPNTLLAGTPATEKKHNVTMHRT